MSLSSATETVSSSDAEVPVAANGDGWRTLRDRHLSRRAEHGLAGLWILAVTGAVLAPALARGPMLGTYDLLRSSGLSTMPGVVQHGSYSSSDIIDQMIPWTMLNWTQVHQGLLPLWNPYNGLGLPLAFNWQSASFSLPSLVGYAVPLRYAVTAGVMTTLLVAGSGAYVLGRTLRLGLAGSLMVATVFELSGPLMSWLGWPQAGVMSWGGWLFAAGIMVVREGNRAWSVAFFSVVTAFAIYAGHPESLIVMEVAVAAFLIALMVLRALPARLGLGGGPVRRPATDLIIATVGGCALGAPLLLPALQLTTNSVRSSSQSTAPPPVHDLLYTVFSGFDGMPVVGNFGWDGSYFYNETAAYVGSIAVTLAVVGVVIAVRRRTSVFLAMSVVVVVTGALSFLAPVIHLAEHLPEVGDVNWLRALMPLCLGLAAMAGVGMDAVARSERIPWVRKWLVGVFAGAAVLMALLWLFGRNGGLLEFGRPYLIHTRAESFVWPVIGLAVGLAGVLVMAKRPATGRLVAALLLGFESIFLVTSGEVQMGSSSQGIVATPAVQALKGAVGNSVVASGTGRLAHSCQLGIEPEVNIALGVHQLDLYDPIGPKAYFSTWQQLGGTTGGNVELDLFCPQITSVREARLLGVQYVLEQAGQPGPKGATFVESIMVPNPVPGNPLALRPPNEDLYRIPDAAPITLTGEDGGAIRSPSGGPALSVRSSPDPTHRTIVADGDRAGVLDVRLTDVPGWRATIDGHPLALHWSSVFSVQADIPAGHHVIELHYWPAAFTAGIAAAILAVLLLAGWIVVESRHGRRHRPARLDASSDPRSTAQP